MSILSDTNDQRVVEVVEDRTLLAARALLADALSAAQKPPVRSISMDMGQAFQMAQEREIPNADRVHDGFHVTKNLADTVNQTRRSEHARLSKTGDKRLTKTKYVWLTPIKP